MGHRRLRRTKSSRVEMTHSAMITRQDIRFSQHSSPSNIAKCSVKTPRKIHARNNATILKATGNMSCTRCCRNLQDPANKKVVFCFGTSGCRDGRATHATEAKCLDDAIRRNHQGHQFAEKGLRLTCCVQLSLSHRPVLLQCSAFRLQCSCSSSKGSCVPVIMLMLKNIERCGRIFTSICRTPLGTASLASSSSSTDSCASHWPAMQSTIMER